MITPSYEHYGTHDSSAYPELWDGCIGAWAPFLGPSGDKLYDLSVGANHGAFTGMSAGSDWVISNGYPAIELDGGGGNDSINCGSIAGFVLPELSLITGVSLNALLNNGLFQTCIGMSNSGANAYRFLGVEYNKIQYGWAPLSSSFRYYTTESLLTVNTRAVIAATHKHGNAPNLYHNGDSVQSTLTLSSGSDSLPALYQTSIGNLGAYSGAAFGLNGKVDFALAYSRVLDNGTIKEISVATKVMFSPRRPRRFYSFAETTNRRRRLLLGAAA